MPSSEQLRSLLDRGVDVCCVDVELLADVTFRLEAGGVDGGFDRGLPDDEEARLSRLDELTELYVTRGLSPGLARQVAIELTAHDALAAHAEAEYGITPASQTAPLRDALAVSAAFAAGALIPWLTMVLIPRPSRALVTFVIVLLALALTGWISARISDVRSVRPVLRMAGIGALAMVITFIAGRLLYP